MRLIRRLGVLTETIHSVVYFAPEPQVAYAELGLRGYWRGYFASRTAAVGPVSAELATALLGGFARAMVARALPQVWATTSPDLVLDARLHAARAALERVLADNVLPDVTRTAELTSRCLATMPLAGRPMAAAHVGVTRPHDPLAALWHDCTALREHRGDGHLAAVNIAGLVWPEPHLIEADRLDPAQQQYRGWDDASWQAARNSTRNRDLHEVEALTDLLAVPAYQCLDSTEVSELITLLEPLASAAATEVPYPNAMGLLPI